MKNDESMLPFLTLGFNENWSGDNTWFNFDENQGNFSIQTSGLQFDEKYKNSTVKEMTKQWPNPK